MNILNLERISKSFENRVLLDQVTVGISDRDRIGVIGVNGTGKSTLLAIAAGALEPDEGQTVRGREIRISYLSQNPDFDPDHNVVENVAAMVYGNDQIYHQNGEIKAMLARFGIDNPEADPRTLSGGQRKRAALAAALLTPCDLLILDEPTNHLDNEMIEWLQDYLQHYRGAILMVTHDRYFLDMVTTEILEIDHGKTYRYETNYSGYLELKQQRLEYAEAAERKMATLYRKDLAWIQRGARARSTKQKAHIARFEALRDRDKIVIDREVEINSLQSRLGNKTIELKNVSKSYGGHTLFRDFSYTFLKNDRIGIIGPNGCGKSTLMKTIVGLVPPDEGTIEIGQTVHVGYFSQEAEMPDGDMRVIDYVKETAEFIRTKDGLTSASAMCEKFLFDSNMQYTPVSKLSGGERRRLYLLRILMEAPNVLILDEPTNDLDIATLRVLEDYLDGFSGIVIAVSHDRYFLDRVVTRIFAFSPEGILRQNEGGYEEYRERMLMEAEDSAAGRAAAGKNGPSGRNTSAEGDENPAPLGNTRSTWKDRSAQPKKKLSFKEQREYDTIEDEIDSLTQKSEELDRAILKAASDFVELNRLTKEKAETDELLEAKMERFIELQDMVDALGG
ncbi:ABC-F family ATP-binding cassette domain-containing protein [[Clostridium] aminophilum]|uniref:ATP-binding cassette, subfamily F, uup n=1 Tax=[Clostridium] aminophilum TaxID=1526 RepID=A0A1I6IJK4_9FIRM|nr:ABC-F family ATP-binding cassette domain-containing protein [[Clostridium] aminophilum]SFR66915.1 ATP-binding cassette, subfamily F, uup [[Clostridium] aminophilum]